MVSKMCQSWADLQGISGREEPLSISRELHNGQAGTVGFWDSRSGVGLFAVFQEDAKSQSRQKGRATLEILGREPVPPCPPALWGLLVRTGETGVHVWLLRVAEACSFFSFPLEFSRSFPNGRAGE